MAISTQLETEASHRAHETVFAMASPRELIFHADTGLMRTILNYQEATALLKDVRGKFAATLKDVDALASGRCADESNP